MSMHPLNNYVVIKPYVQTKTDSGILISEAVKDFRQEGEVVAVGPGKKDEEMAVSVGDHVFFNKYSDATIKQGDEEYVVVSQDQIFLIIK